MLKQDEHEGLCGLGRRSVIPYIHRRESCIDVCVCVCVCVFVCVVLFKAELNLCKTEVV
jgi:hypothetical protein